MGKLEKIIEELKHRIDRNVYPSEIRLPSEYDLADELGVNRITLNKAVNKLIADGYLRRGSSSRDGTYVCDRSNAARGILGMLIRCSNLYACRMLNGVLDGASRNNYLLTVMSPSPEELPLAIQKMTANNVQGIFLSSYGNIPMNAPGVYIDSFRHSDPSRNSISADVYSGGLEMARALLEAGHREIAFCMYSSFPVEKNARCAAFLRAMQDHNIPSPEQHFFYTNHRESAQILQMIFSAFPHTTAIIGENDALTFRLYTEMRKTDPLNAERITFGGFGNQKEVQDIYPFVTLEQHPYEVGCRAVELFLESRTDNGIRHELIPTSPVNLDRIKKPFR